MGLFWYNKQVGVSDQWSHVLWVNKGSCDDLGLEISVL